LGPILFFIRGAGVALTLVAATAATKPVSHGDASRVAPASRATTYTDPPHTTALTNRRLSRVHHVILIWLGLRA